jgi:galactose mutarotase-like enzyme
MPSVTEHLAFIAANLADHSGLGRFASRMSINGSAEEVVVNLGGRNLSIRASGQGVAIGAEEIGLGDDPQETLGRVANRLALRLSQMDGQAN